MKLALFVLFALVAEHVVLASVHGSKPVKAKVRLWPRGIPSSAHETPLGVIEFEEIKSGHGHTLVVLHGEIRGIFPANAKHGFHVHETANYIDGCNSTGEHFNPMHVVHGDITQPLNHRHIGDLGNVHSDKRGVVRIHVKDKLIRLSGGTHSVVGRALVIHEKEDDLGLGTSETSKRNGNAGRRLACGTIELVH